MTARAQSPVREVAAEVRSWLVSYREDPSPFVLLIVVRRLCEAVDPGAAAEAAGVSVPWLREQGELSARASIPAVRDASGTAVKELRSLRLLLPRLGVPCDGWEVTDAEIADALLRHARQQYRSAVRLMSPCDAWEVLQLAADGYVASLDAIAPGAGDVVAGYAARYVRESADGDDGLGAELYRRLREMLPALDQAVPVSLQRAGIPIDEAGLQHAEDVANARHFWELHQEGDDDGNVLAIACAPLLGERTVCAGEIGAAEDDIWAAARSWVAGQVTRIEAGDHEACRRLSTFASWSRLGYAPFGITATQVAAWEEAAASDCWARARAGDGQAALDVVVHCEEPGNSYEGTTGLPRDEARAELQAVMNAYAAGLIRQIQSAAASRWARPPYQELRKFAMRVLAVNDHAETRGGRPLVDTPWEMPQSGWDSLYTGHVRARP